MVARDEDVIRNEVLEEAAKACERHLYGTEEFHHGVRTCIEAIVALKREPNAAGQDRVAGDDQQCLSSGATSRSTPSGESPAPAASIIALLGEARGYLEGLELAERIDAALASSGPAPAAPDVECCCAAHHPNHGRCLQCPIHGTLPPGASDE